MLDITALVLGVTLCCVAIKAFHGICSRYGHVDRPGGRKRHAVPTPLCGGFAIGVTVLFVGAVTAFSWNYAGLSLGLLVVAIVGAFDDARPVPAWVRLGVQVLAAFVGMFVLGGLKLSSLGALFGPEAVTLGWWAVPLMLFGVVGLLNAINMIDGLDGLAGGYSLLVFTVLAVAGVAVGRPGVTLLCVFIGATLAFLAFNMRAPWRRRASIFLGDAGSLVLGFGMAWFAVAFSQGKSPVLRPITMIWLFGLPLVDTGYLMISRTVSNHSPMLADRRHFHHLLLRKGFSVGQACWVWLVVAALFMLVGLFGEWMDVAEAVMFYGFLALFTIYCILNAYLWSHAVVTRDATQSI